MRVAVFVLPVLLACGSDTTTNQPDSGTTQDGSTNPNDSSTTKDGTTPPSDGGTITWNAGNPNGSCTAGVPAKGKAADVSKPTTVVGTGTPASCTFAALQTAVTTGGVITFNCGSASLTIGITATLKFPTNKNSVIDGGRLITLDGQSANEILRWDSPGYRTNTNTLTVQHIAFTNAKTNPVQAIPTAPPPCSQGYDDGEGGAIYVRDAGDLIVIDSIFTSNKAAQLGPDTGGGGIYINGSKNGVLVVGSTLTNNSGANAGAIGALNAGIAVYNSLVSNNTATGHDANNDDPKQCSVMNNGQNEIGSGGNGGGLYADGTQFDFTVCGTAVLTNAAGTNAFGGGIFFTSDDFSGVLSIVDSTVTGNTGGHWTNVTTGAITNAGTAVGTNAKSITITNSTVQGYP